MGAHPWYGAAKFYFDRSVAALLRGSNELGHGTPSYHGPFCRCQLGLRSYGWIFLLMITCASPESRTCHARIVSCRPVLANHNNHGLYLFLIGLEPSTLTLERLFRRHGKHRCLLLWFFDTSISGVRVRLWYVPGVGAGTFIAIIFAAILGILMLQCLPCIMSLVRPLVPCYCSSGKVL